MPELELDESTVLHGRGLVLRTWLPEDLDALLEACQDPEIQHWTPLPSPYLPEHAELFLDACALRWVHGLASFAILRGRGVATAATGVICDWAFGTLEFNRVEWQAYVGNEGSRRVAERCGFTFEGTLRGRGYQRGEYRDIWIAGLLRSDGRPDVPDATGHQSAGS